MQRKELDPKSMDEVLQNLKPKDHMKDYFRGFHKKRSNNIFDKLGVDEA